MIENGLVLIKNRVRASEFNPFTFRRRLAYKFFEVASVFNTTGLRLTGRGRANILGINLRNN
jgi:hypothetical protein